MALRLAPEGEKFLAHARLQQLFDRSRCGITAQCSSLHHKKSPEAGVLHELHYRKFGLACRHVSSLAIEAVPGVVRSAYG